MAAIICYRVGRSGIRAKGRDTMSHPLAGDQPGEPQSTYLACLRSGGVPCRSWPDGGSFRAGLDQSGAGLENLPLQHSVGITRPLLSEPWVIYRANHRDGVGPEVGPLWLLAPIPDGKPGWRSQSRETALYLPKLSFLLFLGFLWIV